jgi:hypothetical protein
MAVTEVSAFQLGIFHGDCISCKAAWCEFADMVYGDIRTAPPALCNVAAYTQYPPPLFLAQTLFHEFGHGLQHMLTTVPHGDAAGINNVEWDAVELPSQVRAF